MALLPPLMEYTVLVGKARVAARWIGVARLHRALRNCPRTDTIQAKNIIGQRGAPDHRTVQRQAQTRTVEERD